MSARDPSELSRWLTPGSDVPPEFRAALAELGDSSGDEALLARLEARLSPLFGAPGGTAEPSLPPEAASGAPSVAPGGASVASVTLKLGGFVLVGAGAIAAALGGSQAEPREAARYVAEPAPRIAEPAPRVAEPAEVVQAVREPAPAATLPLPPPSTARALAAPARPPVHRLDPVASAEPASTVAEEARLLRSAREATGTSLDRALSLLAEHERVFPRGELREERELFTIDVLVRAGRTDEAVARVERLRRLSPGSPHLGAAERLVSKTTVRR